jgi:hypothetical protein
MMSKPLRRPPGRAWVYGLAWKGREGVDKAWCRPSLQGEAWLRRVVRGIGRFAEDDRDLRIEVLWDVRTPPLIAAGDALFLDLDGTIAASANTIIAAPR